jgi:hypothetical protein
MNAFLIALLGISAISAIVILILFLKERISNRKLSVKSEQVKTEFLLKIQSLETVISRLSKYEGISDADEKAKQMLFEAKTVLENGKRDAENVLSQATLQAQALMDNTNKESSKISEDAKQQAKILKENAKNILDSATQQSGKIIEDANKKAQEIAGKAYDALKHSELYEQTAKAMKNIIEGYGDEYIIPEKSLLDDLAEDFGFTQAGEELKRARDRTKSMVKNKTAAMCDYVEQNRKDTAINFILDAFNGKVDSILSRVKHDNAGTLAQEIKDAFTVVNYNGHAFRDAQISEEYLAARLDELKWGETAQQLKLQEREEQRRIKEQLREEEKARREYERAMRDAAKEEEYLKKAMEKAHIQIEQASAEQKEKFEKQLQELELKLKEAEEKNQKALSMAQQTRKGYVYIISNIGSFGENVYKIGLTRRLEPLDRVRELGDSSVPFEFDVHALILSDDAPSLETKLHKHFLLMQLNKVNHRKEFFRTDIHHIKEELDKFELQVKWTLTAEAREYRETLAIEKAIKDDPEKRNAWLKRQFELEKIEDATFELVEDEKAKQ